MSTRSVASDAAGAIGSSCLLPGVYEGHSNRLVDSHSGILTWCSAVPSQEDHPIPRCQKDAILPSKQTYLKRRDHNAKFPDDIDHSFLAAALLLFRLGFSHCVGTCLTHAGDTFAERNIVSSRLTRDFAPSIRQAFGRGFEWVISNSVHTPFCNRAVFYLNGVLFGLVLRNSGLVFRKKPVDTPSG